MDEPVTLIDYGAGNLRSLRAAFERAGARVTVADGPGEVCNATRLVLPGVGAAGPAMRALRRGGLDDAILRAVDAGASLLGVCLGMQLLFERSEEGGVPCLGLLPGSVERIGWTDRLPHMGWNDVTGRLSHRLAPPPGTVCYFAHSYCVRPADADVVVAETELDGQVLPSIVACGRLSGTQFHPEKSGPAGRSMLGRWLGVPVAA
jgi:glutamine amidotransferase